MKWYIIMVLLCISLMTNDAEHLFVYLKFIYLWWDACSNFCQCFKKLNCLFSYCSMLKVIYVFLDMSHLFDMWFENIFLTVCGLSFHRLWFLSLSFKLCQCSPGMWTHEECCSELQFGDSVASSGIIPSPPQLFILTKHPRLVNLDSNWSSSQKPTPPPASPCHIAAAEIHRSHEMNPHQLK